MENETNGLEVEVATANDIQASKLKSLSLNEVTDQPIDGKAGQENGGIKALDGDADNGVVENGDAMPVGATDGVDQMNEVVNAENGVEEKGEGPETVVPVEEHEKNVETTNETEQPPITETTTQADRIADDVKTHEDDKPVKTSEEIENKVPDPNSKVLSSPTKKSSSANTEGSPNKSPTHKERKTSPSKTVSSRLFAPTASSQNKLRGKIDKEGHPEAVKKTGERPRPISAPPNSLSRTSTPRTRPTTSCTAPVSPTKSPVKKSTGTWGTPPPRKPTSAFGKPPPPKQVPEKTPQTKPTSSWGRPSSAQKTDPSTRGNTPRTQPISPRKTVPTNPRSPVHSTVKSTVTKEKVPSGERQVTTRTVTTNGKPAVGSTETKRSVTKTNGSPSRLSSATTKRTVTTIPAQRVSSAPTTVRTKTVMTQSKTGPDGKVVTTKTTSVTKGGSPSKTGGVNTTRTVTTKGTTTQKGVMSPRHKSTMSSPRKTPPLSPSHQKNDGHPESLTLSPRHSIEPGSPKSSVSPGRYPIYEHHELGRSDAIIKKLNEFRSNKIFTDLILKVGKNEIYCHRMIMAACSDYFRQTLSCTFSAGTDIIDIRGVQGSILQTIVDYAYTSTVSVPKREVNSILEAANLFQIDTLSEACNDFVTNGELAHMMMNQPKPAVPDVDKQAENTDGSDPAVEDTKEGDNAPVVKEPAVVMPRRSSTFDFYDHHHNNKMLQTLNDFRPTSQFVDVFLKCGHEILPCHRALLSACSDHFLAMFTEKKRTDTVVITDIKGDVLKKLIDYIYTSKITFTERDLYKVFEAAKKLLVNDGCHACFSVMAKILNASSCLKTLKVADTAGNTDLAQKSRAYALSRFVEACQFEYFPHISKERLVDLVSSDELCVPKEEMLFVAIMSWIDHDAENRKPLLPELLSTIRFKHIAEAFITDDILAHEYIKDNAELVEQIEKLKMVESEPRKYGGSMARQ